ncbi:hypothetical protein DFR58_103215 [Anaerobacterium chartisolvens]|uniref:ABC-2 family transporter n=1 Tax=Anaerobacterium chartisolvens TaxID=1297424 RepID=A0A369BFT3_9FIRM|nr:hypothetical protein [Anaerobacterium chartisolvens]RCX19468.1 hypothetical protein DFR58_103215 [Anaerobacterium chartisolvens]
MDAILYIIKNDIRSIINKRSIAFSFIFAIGIFIFPPYKVLLLKAQLVMSIFPLLLIIVCSTILVREFEYDTYKYIFTGKLSRICIVVSKSFSAVVIAVILGVIFNLLALIGMEAKETGVLILIKQILSIELVFICFTLFISSIAFFLSMLTKSFIFTFLVLYIMFYDTFISVLQMAANKIKIDFLKSIFSETPFLKAMEGFRVFYYPAERIFIMIGISMIILLADCIIIRKMDL